MASFVRHEIRERVALVVLQDPDTLNALSDEMVDALVGTLVELDRNPAIHAAVITGAGKGFCSGGSLKEMVDGTGVFSGEPLQVRHNFVEGIQRLPRLLHNLEMPLVAAVNGAAYGAGLDLACMCDIRVVAENALFAESFVRVGLVAGDGGSWFLPRLVGLGRAMEMTLTGDPINARDALAYGLVNAVVPADGLVEHALTLAARIARHPRQVLRLNRKLLRQSLDASLDQSLDMAAAFQSLAINSPEQQSALRDFLGSRKRPG